MKKLLYILSNEKRRLKSEILLGEGPRLKIYPQKKSEFKLLLIASLKPNELLTVQQTIFELIEKSAFTIDLLNVWAGVPRMSKKDLNEYKGIIIHNTFSYHRSELDILNELILKKFEGIKILMKQDEHFRTNRIVEFVKRNNIDLILTIWDEETARGIYSDEKSNVEVMQYLTGYIPEEYRRLNYKIENREIDVGYRGSINPLIFGRLCYEKRKIGDDFIEYAMKYGLITDISSKKEDRFLGKDWLDFLGNCKSVLGVESGSSIVDYDGNVYAKYKRYIFQNPQATEEEILAFLEPYEQGISYCAVSPRHFEAAACRTLQVMYEGDFQGIFKSNRHYISLKKDFSNIEEVVEVILDDRHRKEIVDCAFEEIVMNDEYSFKTFVKKFDTRVLMLLEKR